MNIRHTAALAAAFSALAFAPVASAQLYYDANNTTAGVGGTGNWITSGAPTGKVWSSVATGGTANNGGTADLFHWDNTANANTTAFFVGTAGTVTVNSAVSVGSLTFSVTGYTIAGASPLTLAAASTISVATGTATISAPVAGAGTSLTKSGAGTLVLSGTNTYTGSTVVGGGTLRINASAALPSASAVTISNGATLQLASGGSYSAGTLTLGSGGGMIDFGGITNTLTFAGFTGAGTVDVVNYTHSGSSYIRFTSYVSGLTNAFTIGGEAAAIAANGDLILASAIPEPSSVALLGALGALGFAATRRRRAVAA